MLERKLRVGMPMTKRVESLWMVTMRVMMTVLGMVAALEGHPMMEMAMRKLAAEADSIFSWLKG